MKTMDYRTALRAKGFKPLGNKKLRTPRLPGTVEIVPADERGKWKLHRYEEGEQAA